MGWWFSSLIIVYKNKSDFQICNGGGLLNQARKAWKRVIEGCEKIHPKKINSCIL